MNTAGPCPVHHLQVVCTTLTGVGARRLDRLQFDVVVIDEAAQVGGWGELRWWWWGGAAAAGGTC